MIKGEKRRTTETIKVTVLEDKLSGERVLTGSLCQGHSSLCKYASRAVSTLGYRCLTYPQNLSELPFLPNKSQALVTKQGVIELEVGPKDISKMLTAGVGPR